MDMSVQLDAERETSSSASTDYLSTTLGTSEMNSQSPLSQQNSACNSPVREETREIMSYGFPMDILSLSFSLIELIKRHHGFSFI